jgi:aryl-alcohol dehydrogenase-like predicted oxidoreductase
MTYGTPDWLPWVLDYDSALPILKAAYESGITTWDTADMYSNGESERVVGRAMKELKIPRSDIVIMTKAFFPTMDSVPAEHKENEEEKKRQWNLNKAGLSRAALFHAVDASLERLQTEYIDVFQIHRLDDTPFVEVMKALHDIIQSGKVRYIGASSMWCHEFAQMQAIARQNGWTEFVSMQNEHNLLYREEGNMGFFVPSIDPVLIINTQNAK